jgi:hypothetical protein
MSDSYDDDWRRELLELLPLLHDDDKCDLLSHARWLAINSRLIGGPFDGLQVPERFKDAFHLSIEIDGRAAFYDCPFGRRLRFSGFARIGGEGGTWPDIRAEELQALKGGAQ